MTDESGWTIPQFPSAQELEADRVGRAEAGMLASSLLILAIAALLGHWLAWMAR